MASLRLLIDSTTFRDQKNREVILRGINVDASAKFPKTPDLPSYVSDGFYDGDNVSFVGRPFVIQDASTHFDRLKRWGYNKIRYIFTWEAIEHAGPGQYDDGWISFTIEILRLMKNYRFFVCMDPHQDVWSRFSGGSGAPMWTLYAMGFDPRNFNATQAALVQNTYKDPASFKKMVWSTNYYRLVCQTVFTLFWAGRDFAPKAIINGQNIQDYLQDHFIAAIAYFAKRIHEAGDLENEVIIGWESMNEPNRGLVGYQDISVIPADQHLRLGTVPTAFEAMLTGSGRTRTLPVWDFGTFGPYKNGQEEVNRGGASAWLPKDHDDSKYGWRRDPQWKLGECLWAQHGVWDQLTDTLLKKDYFAIDPKDGKRLDYDGFINQYFLQHYRKYRDTIRSIHTDAILFCQPPVNEVPPSLSKADDDSRMVHAVHYYDGLTLMTKHWNSYYNVDMIGVLRGKYSSPIWAIKFGETAIRQCMRDQLSFLREESLQKMGKHPAVLTEIGIPYDMDNKKAYQDGDYGSQIRAMDANHFAIEGSGMNGFSLWTYTATNNHKWGDNWNGEDLSIYSVDDAELPTVNKQNLLSSSASSLDCTSPAFSNSQVKTLNRPIEPDDLTQAVSPSSISSATSTLKGKMGYRAAEAFIRPSPVAIHGSLVKFDFDLANCAFTMSLKCETSTPEDAPTVIYLPEFHYPNIDTDVSVTGGKWRIDIEAVGGGNVQYLKWWHAEGDQKILINGAKGASVTYDAGENCFEQCRRACIIM